MVKITGNGSPLRESTTKHRFGCRLHHPQLFSRKSMTDIYNAASIDVLTGLDPVRVRPGMYTDTRNPNHLAHEVIDNAVDEATAKHATRIAVTLFADGSLEVADDGRGMPVDIHPEEKISGVELIMTRLHAGGKFSNKNYQFAGGLHGVGISVVNALSERVDVYIKRDSQEYFIQFAQGERSKPLKVVGTAQKKETGTRVRFWPEKSYFDSPKFVVSKLKHVLKAKAVLCSGLLISFKDETNDEFTEWFYEDGLRSYLSDHFKEDVLLPNGGFVGKFAAETENCEWALAWIPDTVNEALCESYVNLIPTTQGGTHVNGLRTGLLDAVREFCEFRDLLPRGIKLTAEDVWDNCHYVLSLKMQDPQFAGQTKERLASRQAAAFVCGVVKDTLGLWLNQHTDEAALIVNLAIQAAQKRLRKAQKIERKKITSGPALPGKLADCSSQDLRRTELFLVEGDSAGGSAKQARDKNFQAIMPLRGKILNTWEVDSNQVLGSQEVHDIAVAIGIDPGINDLSGLRYGKVCILADADSDGLHIATLLCALFLKHFRSLVKAGHVYVAMPPLYRIDIGKNVYYALDDSEKQGVLDRISAERLKGKINVQRFKGLGEMNPLQLRETTMATETRRLVQLTLDDDDDTTQIMDMLLSKKRASDRKQWLEDKGNLAGDAS